MTSVDSIFDLLDRWRHLPDYQLERRADIFIALFLEEVLSLKSTQSHLDDLGLKGINGRANALIPEFPVVNNEADSRTKKPKRIDYFVRIGQIPLFIELKTDQRSAPTDSRQGQLDTMLACRNQTFSAHLSNLVNIAVRSPQHEKYCSLFDLLAEKELIERAPARGHIQAAYANHKKRCIPIDPPTIDVAISAKWNLTQHPEILFIAPRPIDAIHGYAPPTLTLNTFADGIEERFSDVPLARRVAGSLKKWSVRIE